MKDLQLERINTLWFICLGVTSMAGSLLIYILIIESALGAFNISDTIPTNIVENREPQVAIWQSDYTKRSYESRNPQNPNSGWVDADATSWTTFILNGMRQSVQTISDSDVELGNLDAFDVLVIPSVQAMSDQQITNVKRFMERGGNVVATWNPGTYTPDGVWRGWDFVSETFGVAFESWEEREAGNYSVYQDTFPGYSPPGKYLPVRRQAVVADTLDAEEEADTSRVRISLSMQERMQQIVQQNNLPQLRGYRWVDTLNTSLPQADFVLVDTTMARLRDLQGRVRRQQAVIVTYYRWNGRNRGDEIDIPYPYTNPGIQRLTYVGGTPLTANVTGGYRVKIQVYNQGVRMRIVEPRTKPAAFWYDFATEKGVLPEALNQSAAIVYGTYGRGRFVYMGFQRDALGLGPNDREDAEKLQIFYANLMNYVLRKPIIWVQDWPGGLKAGAVFSGIGERNVGNFTWVSDELTREGMAATYFLRPTEVTNMTNIVRRLHETGEVAVYDDLRREEQGTQQFQSERLGNLKDILENIIEDEVYGYRSAERGQLSLRTMQALLDGKYRYFEADSIGRKLMPKIMGDRFQRLIRIGATARNDRALFDPNIDTWRLRFREDIIRVGYEGSMYNLVFSSDVLGDPQYRPVLRSIIRDLKEGDFWVATGQEMAHWWRSRGGLNADVEQRGDSRLFVRISNSNNYAVGNLNVTIALGQAVSSVSIRPEVIKVALKEVFAPNVPEPIISEDGTMIVLPIDNLDPQQYRIYNIDLLNRTATGDFAPIQADK